jgi:hypothetical protein
MEPRVLHTGGKCSATECTAPDLLPAFFSADETLFMLFFLLHSATWFMKPIV